MGVIGLRDEVKSWVKGKNRGLIVFFLFFCFFIYIAAVFFSKYRSPRGRVDAPGGRLLARGRVASAGGRLGTFYL